MIDYRRLISGINPLPTFDWNNIVFRGDPLVVPAFAMFNHWLGLLVTMVVTIGLWYSNLHNTAYLPSNSNKVFDNTGKHYNVSKVLNSEFMLDKDKYQSYSQPWMSAGNSAGYCGSWPPTPVVSLARLVDAGC